MEAINLYENPGFSKPKSLQGHRDGLHATFYLPLKRSSTLVEIRAMMREKVHEAKVLLKDSLPEHELEAYLAPLWSFIEDFEPPAYTRGVALFRTPGSFFHSLLWIEPPCLWVVGDRFHIKPLLRWIPSIPKVMVITVTSRQVRLFRLGGQALEPIDTFSNDWEEADRDDPLVGRRKQVKEHALRFIRDVSKRILKTHDFYGKRVALFGPRMLRKKLGQELARLGKVEIFYESAMRSHFGEMYDDLDAPLRRLQGGHCRDVILTEIFEEQQRLMEPDAAKIRQGAKAGWIETLLVDPKRVGERSDGFAETRPSTIADPLCQDVLRYGGQVVFLDDERFLGHHQFLAKVRW